MRWRWPGIGDPAGRRGARDAIYNGFHSAPSTIGNGRASSSGDLQRRHAEILFPREDERTAAGGVVLHFSIGEPAQERGGRARFGREARAIRSIADDQQPSSQ